MTGQWLKTIVSLDGGEALTGSRQEADRKQKAQIAVAVITTLPQLIWAIAFLLSTLMGS